MRDVKFHLDTETKKLTLVEPPKMLIITSGDTSDVDGFLALAEYSKVRNLPVARINIYSHVKFASYNRIDDCKCWAADRRRCPFRDELPGICRAVHS